MYHKNIFIKKIFSSLVAVFFGLNIVFPPYVYSQISTKISLPPVGSMLYVTEPFNPVFLKGMKLSPENPFQFDFILNPGDVDIEKQALEEETTKLVRYFLSSLTVPEKDVWVNLSPYEAERVIPTNLSATEMGRDLLAQDYLLKQLTASLMYPEDELGGDFWDAVYEKAFNLYGTTNIPLNTFNKVWIIPEKAVMYEQDNSVFIVERKLKVMLESDYLALQKNLGNERFGIDQVKEDDAGSINGNMSEVVREVLIPAIEKEVNEGEIFANLRQIYDSMILAAWFKKNLRQSIMGQIYVDQNKVSGIDLNDKETNQGIYEQYIQAFKKGVYDYIRDDFDPATQQIIPRKYFSGGFVSSPLDGVNLENMLQFIPENKRMGSRGRVSSALTRGAANGDHIARFELKASSSVAKQKVDKIETPKVIVSSPIQGRISLTGNYSEQDIELLVSKAKKAGRVEEVDLKQYHTGQDLLRKKSKELGIEIKRVRQRIKVIDTGSQSTFQIAVLPENDGKAEPIWRVHIEKSYLQEIAKFKKKNGMLQRKIWAILVEGTEAELKQMEYEYAKVNFPQAVKNLLFKKNMTGEDVIQTYRDNFLGIQESLDKFKNEFAHDETLSMFTFEEISEDTRKKTEEMLRNVKFSVYTSVVDALDGKINLTKRVRFSDNDPELTEKERKESISMVELAYSGNPPTNAHTVIASLKAGAVFGSDSVFSDLTKGDFRKPHLIATFQERLNLNRAFFEKTGGMVRIAPGLGDSRDPGLNGEEKIEHYVDLNKERAEIEFGYGAGDDHLFSFVREEVEEEITETVVFEELTEKNYSDYSYYFSIPAYTELLQKLWVLEFQNIPGERASIVQKLKDSSDVVALIEVRKREGKTTYLPKLDTIGKLWLIWRKLQDKGIDNLHLKAIITERLGVYPDLLRDELSKDIEIIMNSAGVTNEISSSKLRKGLLKFFQDHVIDNNLLFGMPADILRFLMENKEHREYLYSLISVDENASEENKRKIQLSNSMDYLFPLDIGVEKERREQLKEKLIQDLKQIIGSKISVFERREGKRSILNINRVDEEGSFKSSIMDVVYAVRSLLDGKDRHNYFKIKTKPEVGKFPKKTDEKVRQIEDAVQTYIKELNFIRQEDSPLYTDQQPGIVASSSVNVGGIRLDSGLLDWQIQRDGNGFVLPLDQQPLLQMDINGLTPVFMYMMPINTIQYLGLENQNSDDSDDIVFYQKGCPINRIKYFQDNLTCSSA